LVVGGSAHSVWQFACLHWENADVAVSQAAVRLLSQELAQVDAQPRSTQPQLEQPQLFFCAHVTMHCS